MHGKEVPLEGRREGKKEGRKEGGREGEGKGRDVMDELKQTAHSKERKSI